MDMTMDNAIPKQVPAAVRHAHDARPGVRNPKEGGAKARGSANWTGRSQARAAEEEVDDLVAVFRNELGSVDRGGSGNAAFFSFNDHSSYQLFKVRATEAGIGSLVERIEMGDTYWTQTPDPFIRQVQVFFGLR
jgi:hypothetical protein